MEEVSIRGDGDKGKARKRKMWDLTSLWHQVRIDADVSLFKQCLMMDALLKKTWMKNIAWRRWMLEAEGRGTSKNEKNWTERDLPYSVDFAEARKKEEGRHSKGAHPMKMM